MVVGVEGAHVLPHIACLLVAKPKKREQRRRGVPEYGIVVRVGEIRK